MKVLLAYSSKTKNTRKVAEAIYNEIKNLADVTLLDIKKQKTNYLRRFFIGIMDFYSYSSTLTYTFGLYFH